MMLPPVDKMMLFGFRSIIVKSDETSHRQQVALIALNATILKMGVGIAVYVFTILSREF